MKKIARSVRQHWELILDRAKDGAVVYGIKSSPRLAAVCRAPGAPLGDIGGTEKPEMRSTLTDFKALQGLLPLRVKLHRMPDIRQGASGH